MAKSVSKSSARMGARPPPRRPCANREGGSGRSSSGTWAGQAVRDGAPQRLQPLPRPHRRRSPARMAGCTRRAGEPGERDTPTRSGFPTPRRTAHLGAAALGGECFLRLRAGPAQWAGGGWGRGRGRGGASGPRPAGSESPPPRAMPPDTRPHSGPLPTLRVCGAYGWGEDGIWAPLRAGFSGGGWAGKCGSLGVTSPGGALL